MDGIKANVDLTKFNAALERYLSMTSKTMQKACNDKLFDIARFALKFTKKADVSSIREGLRTTSDISPDVTVAEILTIIKMRKKGIKEYSLKKEAQTFTNKRVGAAGYTRSGWIKPMVELLPFIGKTSLSVGGVSKNIGEGGANPVKRPSSVMKGAVWNDVTAKDSSKDGIVKHVKEEGAQEAVNFVTADMVDYIEKKLAPHNAEFSRN
jgi:hypothetical protein